MIKRKIVVLFRGEDSRLEIEGVTDWRMTDDNLAIFRDGAVIASFYRDAVLGIRELEPEVVIEEARRRLEESTERFLNNPFFNPVTEESK